MAQTPSTPTTLITDSPALATLCATLSTHPFIAVDTEFLRDKYYYPKLCLVQIGDANGQYLIDPLAPDIDLAPLWALFTNTAVLKIFHSAKQDIETIFHITGQMITPLYDTQVAAMAIGYFSHTSYAALVSDFLKVSLDKSSQFSQWDTRPLSAKQLTYAADDVRYLYQLYPLLHQKITQQDREHWLEDDMLLLTDPKTYAIDPDTAWQRLSLRDRSPVFLGVVRALASWRELEARRHNRPRTHILKDAALTDIASRRPGNADQLARIRGIHHMTTTQNTALLTAISEGIKNPVHTPPETLHMNGATPEEKYLCDLLKIALYATAKKHHIAERLIASSQDITDLVLRPSAPSPVMSGWRYDMFGKQIEAILAGELSLRVHQGKIDLLPCV